MTQSLTRFTPVLAALALSACASAPAQLAGPSTPLDAWSSSVQAVAIPDEIRLAPHTPGLSGTQARALAEFQARWTLAEGGLITVAAPTGARNAGAYQVSADARAFLISQGARSELVRLVGYDAGDVQNAPIIVGFQRYAAHEQR